MRIKEQKKFEFISFGSIFMTKNIPTGVYEKCPPTFFWDKIFICISIDREWNFTYTKKISRILDYPFKKYSKKSKKKSKIWIFHFFDKIEFLVYIFCKNGPNFIKFAGYM